MSLRLRFVMISKPFNLNEGANLKISLRPAWKLKSLLISFAKLYLFFVTCKYFRIIFYLFFVILDLNQF